MKRIFYILAALLFAVVSCAPEQLDGYEPVSNENKVPIIMSFANEVTLQATTKATDGMEMGVDPAIKTIHVAVFGSSGYLKDYASAIPCDEAGNALSGFVNANATTGYFKVYLPIDDAPSTRRIHIIANGPSSLPFNAYEDDIMHSMTVTDGNGAYWTRFVTNKASGQGILVQTDTTTSGTTRRKDANGEYIPTEATKALFQDLTLVRNFAAVTVRKGTSAASNFEIDGFTVCNMPTEGTVAVYNETSSEWIPAKDYVETTLDSGTALLTYNSTEYPGFPATPTVDTTIPQTKEAFDAAGASVSAGSRMFIYERGRTSDTAPFVLIKARYVPSGGTVDENSPTYFYRLDITLDDNYVPLYRNFNYIITLTGINVAGYDSPAVAAKHNSGDNFSISLDTQTITDVSNGTTRLYVEKSDVSSLYTNETQQLWYQFFVGSITCNGGAFPDSGDKRESAADPNNSTVKVTVEETTKGALASWNVEDSDNNSTDKQRLITYTFNEPSGNSNLTSVLKITGVYNDGEADVKLVRNVTFTVFNKKTVTTFFSPASVAPEADQETSFNINLPWDLTNGMFPMDIEIEDSAQSLNPTGSDLPVRTGTSIIDNSSPSFHFVKTLSWDDYEYLMEDATLSGSENVTLSIPMVTTKSSCATNAYIYNKYLTTKNVVNSSELAYAQLAVDNVNRIMPTDTTVVYNAHNNIVVKVKSGGAWTLSLTLANGAAVSGTSLSTTSGSQTSGTDVTVTLPENNSTKTVTYLLTLLNTTDGITRTAKIFQNSKAFKFGAIETSVKGDGTTTATLHLESDYAWNLTVTRTGGSTSSSVGTLSTSSGAAGYSGNITLTMPVNYSTTSPAVYTVTAESTDGTVSKSVTVTQRVATVATSSSTTTFTTTSGNGFSTSDLTETKSGVTATFSAINAISNSYMTLNNGTTLTLTAGDAVNKITNVSMSFSANNRRPTSITMNPSVGTPSPGTTSTWTYSTGVKTIELTMTRNTNNLRMTQFVVTYYGYTWE